jgi:hypothetical protein
VAHDADEHVRAFVDLSLAPSAGDFGARELWHAIQVGPTTANKGVLSKLSERHGVE